MVQILLGFWEEGAGKDHQDSLQPFLQAAKGLITDLLRKARPGSTALWW